MWDAYFETVQRSSIDWFILLLGGCLLVAHAFGLIMRFHGRKVLFVQHLDRYRTFLLLLTELLPVFGLLGTVLSLMLTFKTFQMAGENEAPDLTLMVQSFAPALSTTISGLLMIGPNLVLNAFLWLASPTAVKGKDRE